jgi:hypothetical protein
MFSVTTAQNGSGLTQQQLMTLLGRFELHIAHRRTAAEEATRFTLEANSIHSKVRLLPQEIGPLLTLVELECSNSVTRLGTRPPAAEISFLVHGKVATVYGEDTLNIDKAALADLVICYNGKAGSNKFEVTVSDTDLAQEYLEEERVTLFVNSLAHAKIISEDILKSLDWKIANTRGRRPALKHYGSLPLDKKTFYAIAKLAKTFLYDGEI